MFYNSNAVYNMMTLVNAVTLAQQSIYGSNEVCNPIKCWPWLICSLYLPWKWHVGYLTWKQQHAVIILILLTVSLCHALLNNEQGLCLTLAKAATLSPSTSIISPPQTVIIKSQLILWHLKSLHWAGCQRDVSGRCVEQESSCSFKWVFSQPLEVFFACH